MIYKEQLISGLGEYLQNEIFSKLDSKREFVAGLIYGILSSKIDNIISTLENTPLNGTLNIIKDGMIDIDCLYTAAYSQILRQKQIELDIPFLGNFIFNALDLKKLYKSLTSAKAPENKKSDEE